MMLMKDEEVIAHQGRKIAELEVSVSRALGSERQLLEILRRAGIEVKEMELTHQEAEFLRLYRSASPEGKAKIKAKAGELAAKSLQDTSGKEDSDQASPDPLPVRSDVKKKATARSNPDSADLSGLPKDFFKPSAD